MTSHAAVRQMESQGEALLERLERNPSDGSCYGALGQIALQSGSYQDAATFFGKAIQLQGPEPRYCVQLAETFSRMGDNGRALLCLEQALREHEDLDLRLALANLYHLENRPREAQREYEAILVRDPSQAEVWFNLGVLHTMSSRLDEACLAYTEAVSRRPQYAEAWNNRALIEHARGMLAEAESSYRRSLMAKPDYRDALYNFALLLQNQDRMLEAAALYERLVAKHPEFAEAHNNLGNCYLKQNRLDEARFQYALALSRQASHKEAPWNLGFASLLSGDYESGWLGYEHRLVQHEVGLRAWNVPRWTGELRAGARILVHHEQGLGDTIQFARYLHPLLRSGMRVDVLCQASLVPLLKRVPGLGACVHQLNDLEIGDWHVPFPSLPYHFQTEEASIPCDIPYLSVDPETVAEWKDLFRHLPPGRKVGLVWQGNPKHQNDRHRSLPPEQLPALVGAPGIHFLSFQKGTDSQRIPPGLTDLGRLFRDFGDTAAALLQLDLLISVDTAVAHLAGALGKPVWLLLPYAPDWRWMLDRSDSPWYPSARLFRQSMPGDWAGVLQEVAKALQAEI